jgi:hypothetical protein
MDVASIKKIIKSSFNHVISKNTYGETTFFYNQVYRLSFKPLISTYKDLFGERPNRPQKGKVVDLNLDFAELNTFLPHPIYAWMGWMMILNPSDSKLESVIKLLNESYGQARDKFEKRVK